MRPRAEKGLQTDRQSAQSMILLIWGTEPLDRCIKTHSLPWPFQKSHPKGRAVAGTSFYG